MPITFKPYQKNNITDVVLAYELESVTEGSICFKEIVNDEIAIKFHNVISKYIDLMRNFVTTYTFNEEESDTYKCQPNLLCYDLYGTPELAYSLLYINNMLSIAEFTRRTIKVFTPNINDVLKELLTLTESDIQRNRAETGLK